MLVWLIVLTIKFRSRQGDKFLCGVLEIVSLFRVQLLYPYHQQQDTCAVVLIMHLNCFFLIGRF
jgi:hypothetical protein